MNDRIKIVLVEDEPVILRSVRRGIEQFGDNFQIEAEAYDGKEALEKIRACSPDIVISDIVMPQMGGLEMTEQAKSQGIHARFILLSGYEEFRYAQKAMDLGVTKYLLKPVDFRELRELLEGMRKEILEERRQEEREHIKGLLEERKEQIQESTGKYYLVILAVWGTMGRSGFYESHPAADLMRETDFGFLGELETRFGKNIYSYPGHYANTCLFVIPAEIPYWKYAGEAAGIIGEHMKTSRSFLTVCYTASGIPGADLCTGLREIYCELPLKIIFGESTFFCYTGAEKTEILCSNTAEHAVEEIHISMEKTHLQQIIKACCDCWKKEQMTQLELQAELRRLFENPKVHHRIDYMGFLFQVSSYEELEKEIFLELERILRPEECRAATKGAALVEGVRTYLDTHFTEEISYKEFQRIFGYNEKYITAVFKERVGMTPSRYVLDKRMELAQKLLADDSGLLLREIAERVGYSDQLYFSKVFKNCTGMSPSSFMKQKKLTESEEDGLDDNHR